MDTLQRGVQWIGGAVDGGKLTIGRHASLVDVVNILKKN